MACVSASIPVEAASPRGMGGHHFRIDNGDLRNIMHIHAHKFPFFFVRNHIMIVTSAAVPAVVGMAIVGAVFLSVFARTLEAHNIGKPGLPAMIPHCLAVSIEDPPPTAIR